MEFLFGQIRHAGRQALKNPGFTSTTLLILALGIGGTTAVLSLISEVLLAPPPYAAPERLFALKNNVSVPNGLDLQAQASTTVEQMTLLDIGGDFSLTEVAQPRNLFGAEVTTNFLNTLGVRPSTGRDFISDEGTPGRHDVVILTSALWRRTFGGDPRIAGRLIRLNDRPVRVVGVTPPDFRFGDVEIFRPLVVDSFRDKRGRRDNMAILRVKPQVSQAQAEAHLNAIAQQLVLRYPQENAGLEIRLTSVEDSRANRAQGPLSMLLTAALFVLLIVAVNVANLLLARGIARRREFALRTALGSSTGRLVGQVVIECTLLFAVGGALGILLAWWSGGILATMAAPYFGPQFEPRLDWRVAACSMGLAVTAGMLCALAPALQARRARLQDVLKSSSQSVMGNRTTRVFGNALVIAEIALAFILLVGTGLMLRSLAQIGALPHGFETAEAVITSTKLPSLQYRAPEQQIAFVTQLLDATKGLPGVKSAGVTTDAPLRGADSMWFIVDGRPRPPKGQELAGRALAVSPDYFRTLGIPLRRGRGIEALDVKNAPAVVVVSETLAKQYFPGQDPLGQRIRLEDDPDVVHEIVGVVADIRQRSVTREFWPTIYRAYAQAPHGGVTLITRVPASQQAFVGDRLRTVLREMDPSLVWAPIVPMGTYIAGDSALVQRRFVMTLLAAFAITALIVAVLGIYGILSYTVAQRTREIGVRIALGATRMLVLRGIVQRALGLTAIGLAFGIAGALIWGRLLENLLYGVTRVDAITYLGVSFVFLTVALAASLGPARRATRIDPLIALRSE